MYRELLNFRSQLWAQLRTIAAIKHQQSTSIVHFLEGQFNDTKPYPFSSTRFENPVDNASPVANMAYTLSHPSQWHEWFRSLRFYCEAKNVWHLVDPEAEDAVRTTSAAPSKTATINELIQIENKKRDNSFTKRVTRLQSQQSQQSPTPAESAAQAIQSIESSPEPADYSDVQAQWLALQNQYQSDYKEWERETRQMERAYDKVTEVLEWMRTTIDPVIFGPAQEQMLFEGGEQSFSVQAIVRVLRRAAPSDISVKITISANYNAALAAGLKGSINARRFYQDWLKAYQAGLLHKISEIEEPLCALNFLKALSKLAPL